MPEEMDETPLSPEILEAIEALPTPEGGAPQMEALPIPEGGAPQMEALPPMEAPQMEAPQMEAPSLPDALRSGGGAVLSALDKVRVMSGLKFKSKKQEATENFLHGVGDMLSDVKNRVVSKKEDTPEGVPFAPGPEGPGAEEVMRPPLLPRTDPEEHVLEPLRHVL